MIKADSDERIAEDSSGKQIGEPSAEQRMAAGVDGGEIIKAVIEQKDDEITRGEKKKDDEITRGEKKNDTEIIQREKKKDNEIKQGENHDGIPESKGVGAINEEKEIVKGRK